MKYDQISCIIDCIAKPFKMYTKYWINSYEFRTPLSAVKSSLYSRLLVTGHYSGNWCAGETPKILKTIKMYLHITRYQSIYKVF